jgi:hypothetical protein
MEQFEGLVRDQQGFDEVGILGNNDSLFAQGV